jgi:hypothetical protein
MADKLTDQVADLKRQLDEMKGTPVDRAAEARWKSEMHLQAERRMQGASAFTREQLREMRAACPDDLAKSIVADHRLPQGHRGVLPTATVGNVRGAGGGAPGNTSGWREPTPLSNPPGINYVDAQCIADDIRQRSKSKP